MLKRISNIFDITFLKFIIVGILNTLFGTFIMFIFYNVFHLNYWISSFSNYFFGSILSFILNKNFTFRDKNNSRKIILIFFINIGICYLIAYGLAKLVIFHLFVDFSKSFQENVAMLLGMCLFVILNYIGQRFIVFSKKF